MKEVERISRESNCYDPERVKNFLKVRSTSTIGKYDCMAIIRGLGACACILQFIGKLSLCGSI